MKRLLPQKYSLYKNFCQNNPALQDLTEVNRLKRFIKKQMRTRGDASAEDHKLLEKARERYGKTLQVATQLSEYLGEAVEMMAEEKVIYYFVNVALFHCFQNVTFISSTKLKCVSSMHHPLAAYLICVYLQIFTAYLSFSFIICCEYLEYMWRKPRRYSRFTSHILLLSQKRAVSLLVQQLWHDYHIENLCSIFHSEWQG